jgi:hypothetical protein
MQTSAADTTAPIVHSVSYSAASAVPGDTITAYADITDDTDGYNIKYAIGHFYNPEGNDVAFISFQFNSDSGLFEGLITVYQYWIEGDYYTSVAAEDQAGNYDETVMVVNKVAISGTTPDTEDPIIHSVEYDRSTVYVDEYFTVYANITDNLSGIDFCTASLYDPSGSAIPWPYSDKTLNYNTQTKLYEVQFGTQSDWDEGNYYVGRIYCQDGAWNKDHQLDGVDYTSDRIFLDLDLEAPDLNSVSINPTFVKIDKSVLVRVNLTDAMNEVASASVIFENMGVPFPAMDLVLNNGFWELNFTVDTLWEGTNQLNEIIATDKIGNTASYYLVTDFLLSDLDVYDPSVDTDGDGLPDGWESHYGYDPDVPGDEDDETDEDGLEALEEYIHGTDPKDADTDDDLIRDGAEVTYGFDPLDPDENSNGILDGNDDEDGDTLTNSFEAMNTYLDPTNEDTDGDCLDDGYEYNLSQEAGHGHTGYSYWLVDDVLVDHDGDGLNWIEEYNIGSHIEFSDTDGDTLDDFDEYFVHHTNPVNNDTDGDTLLDAFEINTSKTDPLDPDTDNDRIRDDYEYNTEIFYKDIDGNTVSDYLNATLYDTDSDGLSDYVELVESGTVPFEPDSDFDGISDYDEYYLYNSSPMANDTDNDKLSDYFELFTSMTNANASDSDLDGLSDFTEYYNSTTDPWLYDTDFDDLNDFEEYVTYGTNPFEADEDNDTLIDSIEVAFGSLTNDNDTDDDLLPDAYEYEFNLDPNLNETYLDLDFDGLTTIMEYYNGTHPNDADPDLDGLNDYYELMNGTDPWYWDSDNDNVSDGDELLLYHTCPLDDDSDNDNISDFDEIFNYVSDPILWSSDGDDLSDFEELFTYMTDCLNNDTDSDMIDDWTEVFVTKTDPNLNDTDFDELNDYDEIYVYFTDPYNPDCDEDGLLDGLEIENNTDPHNPDTDSDYLEDGKEIELGTDPLFNDSDGDTLLDGYEVYTLLSNPLSEDTDGDTLPDSWEAQFGLKIRFDDAFEDPDEDGLTNVLEHYHGTDPTNLDTDSDGASDGEEVEKGFDPLDPNSTPNKDIVGEIMSEPILTFGAIFAFIASMILGARSFGGKY